MPSRPRARWLWLPLTLLLPLAVQAQPPQPLELPVETPVTDLLVGLASTGIEPALQPGQPLRLHYPLRIAAREVALFGWRYSEARQAWRLHTGVDLIADAGQPVLAMLPGRVVLMREVEGYGLTVLLDHGRGWQSLYAHLLDAAVLVGDAVRPGQAIGRVGQSGRASTPHLHVELRRKTSSGTLAFDPGSLLTPTEPQP